MIFLIDDIQITEYKSLNWRAVFLKKSLDRNVVKCW